MSQERHEMETCEEYRSGRCLGDWSKATDTADVRCRACTVCPPSVGGVDLIEARRRFLTDRVVPRGVPLPIVQSWLRSASHGLDVAAVPAFELVTRERLRDAVERNETLVQAAWGELESLCRDTESAGGLVVLTDPQGFILMRVGNPAFSAEADRLALTPGVDWGEQAIGTNAIGMALFEHREISVIGAQHFLDVHSALSCSAMPIFNPLGSVVGALDLSTVAQVPHRYTLALVRRAVEQIERRLFEQMFGRHERMRLHANPFLLGSAHDACLAFEADRLVGVNRVGVELLGLSWAAVGRLRFNEMFSVQHASVHRNATFDECVVQTTRGTTLFARMEPAAAARPAPRPAAQLPEGPAAEAEAGAALTPPEDPVPPLHVTLQRLLDTPNRRYLRVRRLRAGQSLDAADEADDRDDSILALASGRLRLFASSEGKELTLYTLQPGDTAVLHREMMLQAQQDCEFILVRQSAFRQLAREDPGLALAIIPTLDRMAQRAGRIAVEMVFHDVRYRVIGALCELAEREGRPTREGMVIDLRFNGEDLAMQVGATRQSVSTVLAGLVRTGVLLRRGNSAMTIPDVARLRAELAAPTAR